MPNFIDRWVPPLQTIHLSSVRSEMLQLHDAIYWLRFYSNSLIHTLSLSNSDNNVHQYKRIGAINRLKADFLFSQKPLAASSQTNFLSSHLNEHKPSWFFEQRQLNQAITITLRLTEHDNIFLNTYQVVVFSYFYLQPLFPCTRSQQCFTTATIRSFDHFEHVEIQLSLYCDVTVITYSLPKAN